MTTIDENELHEFAGRFIADLGAAAHAATVILGDRPRRLQGRDALRIMESQGYVVPNANFFCAITHRRG